MKNPIREWFEKRKHHKTMIQSLSDAIGDRKLYLIMEDGEDEEEDLGDCGNFGSALYDEGTELCDFCPMSDECHKLYREWMKNN